MEWKKVSKITFLFLETLKHTSKLKRGHRPKCGWSLKVLVILSFVLVFIKLRFYLQRNSISHSHSPSYDFHRNFFMGLPQQGMKREKTYLYLILFSFSPQWIQWDVRASPESESALAILSKAPNKHLLYSFESFSWAISRTAQSCASEKPIVIWSNVN